MILISGGILCIFIYTLTTYTHLLNWGYLIVVPLFIIHLLKMYRYSGQQLDPQLKFLSVSTLLWALATGFTSLY